METKTTTHKNKVIHAFIIHSQYFRLTAYVCTPRFSLVVLEKPLFREHKLPLIVVHNWGEYTVTALNDAVKLFQLCGRAFVLVYTAKIHPDVYFLKTTHEMVKQLLDTS